MKTLAYLILVVLILALLYIFVRLFILKITFKFKFRNIDFSTLSLNEIFNQGQSHVKVLVDALIKNNNNGAVNFSDAHIWFYENGKLIANTSEMEPSNFVNIYVPGNTQVEKAETFDFIVNRSTIALLNRIRSGESVEIDYYVQAKVYGIPFIWQDTFITGQN